MRTTSAFLTITALVIPAVLGGHVGNPLNLKNRLNDKSWSSGRSTLVGVGAANETCSSVLSCADCNTVQICRPTTSGSWEPVQKITCPTDTPYCDYSTGSCTSVPDDSCGQTDNFICLQDGHFPDPDCNVYHVCDQYQAHKFSCNITGEKYNAESEQCEPNTECSSFSCEKTGQKVPNTLYPSYYAYCNATTEVPAYIQRCPGIYQLNVTSQNCEPICESEGVLPDVDDCTKYFKCQYLWLSDTTKFMTRQLLDCPTGTGFDPSNFICISLENYPGCSKKLHKLT